MRSHYLNQCWNIVKSNLRNKLQWNLKRNSYIFIQENAFENVVCETVAILSRFQCSAPSHYLNQCWNIVKSNLRNKLQWNLKRNSYIFIQENAFENVVCETVAILSRFQRVNVSSVDLMDVRYPVMNTNQGLFTKRTGVLPLDLEVSRFGFWLFQSLWNLTDTLAAALPRCLSSFRAILLS